MVSFWTDPFLIFWIFMKKSLVKRKKFAKIVSNNKKNPEHTVFENVLEKNTIFKAIWAVLGHSKPKIGIKDYDPSIFREMRKQKLRGVI